MTETDRLKDLMFYILVGGNEIPEPELVTALVILADYLDVENATFFAEKCKELIQNDEWDDFLLEVKNPLLEDGRYEVLLELYL